VAALHALRVLYEDPHLLALDKPAGLHTAPLHAKHAEHAEHAEHAGTLLAELLARYPEVSAVPGLRPAEHGLLHRLDRETSGVLIVARTAAAFAALRAQFAAQQVRKEYLAVCLPATDAAQAAARRASTPLRLESRFAPYGPGRRKVRVVLPGSGAAARRKAGERLYATEARVLELGEGRARVGAWLLRGFRHQVRAHLAFLGLPILGAPLYGVSGPQGGVPRLYLHAAAVQLTHPLSGAVLRIASPEPAEFAAAMGRGSVPAAEVRP